MYCERCRLLTEENLCPACGRPTRLPEGDEACFLIEKDVIFSGMLADVLKQHDVPFYRAPVLGAGLAAQVGQMLERYRFFVPCACYEKARALAEELFGAPSVQDETEPE